MNENYLKLVSLLKELFQLNQPDLDFGLYRLMHAKSVEITDFLNEDLLPQVKRAFERYKSSDQGKIQEELDRELEVARKHTKNPEDSSVVRTLRAKLEEVANISALENNVYEHLLKFFQRYYEDGEFLRKRVYKHGVYSIPYEGEEVTLHWANKDQYYIKSSEHLKSYTFRLSTDKKGTTMRVHFQVSNISPGEKGNVKEPEEGNRVFILATEDSEKDVVTLVEGDQNRDLTIHFEYRRATLNDWSFRKHGTSKKTPKQEDLITLAVDRILANDDPRLLEWISALGTPHTLATGEISGYSTLEANLRRFTARKTHDYFIHKDLGTFLSRELDFYVKNEVIHLDDIENETTHRIEKHISKIKVFRVIAGKIIDFLAQLENFQKKLWLKKPFVLETQYCITLDQIPNEFYEEIANNELQIQEWNSMYGTSLHHGSSSLAYMGKNKRLPIDTKHFSAEFTARLVATFKDIDNLCCGILVHCDNWQALNLLQDRYEGKVQCTYIDPPFNTDTSQFLFKDEYRTSSWVSMMHDRIQASKSFLTQDGSFYLHLDHNSVHFARMIMDDIFGAENILNEIIWRIGWVSGYKTAASRFVRNHETILLYGNDAQPLFQKVQAKIPYVSFDKKLMRNVIEDISQTWNLPKESKDSIRVVARTSEGKNFRTGIKSKKGSYMELQ